MVSDVSSLASLAPAFPENLLAVASLVLLLVGVLFLKKEHSISVHPERLK